MRTILPLVILFLSFIPPLCADEAVSLLHVGDGDGLHVVRADGRRVSVRLYGIDAPEDGQDGGDEARAGLRELVRGRRLAMLPVTRDWRKRTVALVFADGRNVNAAMVERGLAWVYADYCKPDFCDDWRRLEAAAREARRGLWRAEKPMPPWEWRRQRRFARPSGPAGPEPEPSEYRGNVNTKVFHRHGCPHFNCGDCTRPFHSREDALNADYRPCRLCNP